VTEICWLPFTLPAVTPEKMQPDKIWADRPPEIPTKALYQGGLARDLPAHAQDAHAVRVLVLDGKMVAGVMLELAEVRRILELKASLPGCRRPGRA